MTLAEGRPTEGIGKGAVGSEGAQSYEETTARRPVFVASAVATVAPAADKKAREFPEILSEGLIAIIIVEWVGVVTARHP